MKVKIFVGINIKSMEDEINEFIKDKPVVDIKYQSMGWPPDTMRPAFRLI